MSINEKIEHYLDKGNKLNENMKKKDVKWIKDRTKDMKNTITNLERGIKEFEEDRIITSINQLNDMMKLIYSNSGLGKFLK